MRTLHRLIPLRQPLLRCWLSAAVILAGACVPSAQAAGARYQLDPEHLTVAFLVEHIGYARTLGFFRDVAGSYTFDEDTGELSNIRIVVDTKSVFTSHDKRDKHLRGKDFLNVKKHPKMIFTADKGTPTGNNRYTIQGDLNLLGVTRALTLEATRNKLDNYPFGSKPFVMGVSAAGVFKRSEFGMTYAVDNGWVGDEVEMMIEFEAQRQ